MTAVRVLWVARYDYRPRWVLREHSHPNFWQMIYVVSGRGRMSVAGTERATAAGQLYLLAPALKHALVAEKQTVRTLDIKFTVEEPGLRDLCEPLPSFEATAPSYVKTLLEQILDEALQAQACHVDLCRTYLHQLLLLLVRSHLHSGDRSPTAAPVLLVRDRAVRAVVEYVAKNYRRDLSARLLAQAGGYSYRQLSERFQVALGMSPRKFLLNYRIERAQELMRFSDYELKQIADMVGFKTVHHFTRVFSQVTGQAPARWQERHVQQIGEGVTLEPNFTNTLLTSPRS